MQEGEAVYKLDLYVPTTHIKQVKDALAAAGAGKIGKYDSCMWTTNGLGQFRAQVGSQPFIGGIGAIHHVEEAKIECIIYESNLKDAINAMIKAHPYECPSFQYWKINVQPPQ
ncbi:NGG1p interacting factor NIF3 [Histomonas meleagridis]|uniref:NGG1p interacting factor NIF3 n=1 Tax=Histomonas meleagridis TaxID=135588 RepID=UPI00355A64E4|nr:NGG1p interacting factor NIF3 [Histomonas meleagridis]KAH0796408.1 NGG1p interacting factor NIF3 [Histomonas meleagridis]